METKYKRIENLEELIHSVKLPYHAWKVIFLIEGEVSPGQIAEFLGEDEKVVEESLNRLQKEGLIEPVTDEQVDISVVEEEEDLPISLEDESEEVDESVSIQEESFEFESIETEAEPDEVEELSEFDLGEPSADELPEDDLADLGLEEEAAPPASEEPEVSEDFFSEKEKEDEAEPEFTHEETAISDLISEDVGAVEEETLEEIVEEQEDIDIQIATTEEEADKESAEADLDIDFSSALTPDTDEAPSPPPPPVKESAKEAKTGAKSVLVVDDSIVIRKMVEIALEDENFNIFTAVSGKDGLAVLDDKNPDLLILDLMLPDINGIDMLKTVKASKGIPVIMLSGKDSPQMVEKARAEGADAFLPKPFKDDELVNKIKELLA